MLLCELEEGARVLIHVEMNSPFQQVRCGVVFGNFASDDRETPPEYTPIESVAAPRRRSHKQVSSGNWVSSMSVPGRSFATWRRWVSARLHAGYKFED